MRVLIRKSEIVMSEGIRPATEDCTSPMPVPSGHRMSALTIN
jgi:hypothetical protein